MREECHGDYASISTCNLIWELWAQQLKARTVLSEIPIGPMTNEADWKELFETLLWLQVSSQVEGALVIFLHTFVSRQKYELGSWLQEHWKNESRFLRYGRNDRDRLTTTERLLVAGYAKMIIKRTVDSCIG